MRGIREAIVHSRTTERARRFCDEMAPKLGIAMRVAGSAEEAVGAAHIVNVITKAATPVLRGEWLQAGQHINAAGGNSLARRELDETAVKRCTRVVVDSRATARKECGDLLPLVETGYADWEALPELGEIIAGRVPGRLGPNEITLYESHGMAVQDLYCGARVLELARERGLGVELPIG